MASAPGKIRGMKRLPPATQRISPFALGFAGLLLAASLAGPAAAQTLQTRSAAGEIKLQKSFAGWQLDQGRGPADLPVSPGVRFSALRSAGSVFVAAGVERGPQGYGLVVVRGGQGPAAEVLTPPPVAPGQLAMMPTVLLGPSGLEALLWIEGKTEQSGAVRVALWNGSAFSAPGDIAPMAAGTQTALQAIRLQDGSWLAVWSAYDGQDDEIMWSRGSRQGWSPAKAITGNAVPDITPVLRLVPGGVLAVWSFYDGNDYRLRSARFEDWSWTDGGVFGGKGASHPFFAEVGAQTLVSFRQVEPESWALVELADSGQPKRQVTLPTATRRPPEILSIDDQAVTIEWSSTDAGRTPVSIVVPWDQK